MPMPTPEEQREYQRVWIANRRAAWFDDKVCAHCGSEDNLELDHIDPTKKVTHAIWSWAEARRNEELAKCQPLCERCHKKKTAADREPEHGTESRYKGKWACRCDSCRIAHTLAKRVYRAKVKLRAA